MRRHLLILPLLFILSCKPSIQDKNSLQQYVNNPDNGLQHTLVIGDINAVMTFRPWQLLADKAKKKDDLKNKLFFVLSLSANHKELLKQLDFNTYSEMVQVFSFRMATYIEAITIGEAIAPENCFYQPTYGASRANELLIVFDQTKLKEAKEIVIKVKEFGLNIGDLSFRFDHKKIKSLNNLNIKD